MTILPAMADTASDSRSYIRVHSRAASGYIISRAISLWFDYSNVYRVLYIVDGNPSAQPTVVTFHHNPHYIPLYHTYSYMLFVEMVSFL